MTSTQLFTYKDGNYFGTFRILLIELIQINIEEFKNIRSKTVSTPGMRHCPTTMRIVCVKRAPFFSDDRNDFLHFLRLVSCSLSGLCTGLKIPLWKTGSFCFRFNLSRGKGLGRRPLGSIGGFDYIHDMEENNVATTSQLMQLKMQNCGPMPLEIHFFGPDPPDQLRRSLAVFFLEKKHHNHFPSACEPPFTAATFQHAGSDHHSV